MIHRNRTFSNFKRSLALINRISRAFKHFARWVEVFGHFGMGWREGICLEVVDDGTVEHRLFDAVQRGVVG